MLPRVHRMVPPGHPKKPEWERIADEPYGHKTRPYNQTTAAGKRDEAKVEDRCEKSQNLHSPWAQESRQFGRTVRSAYGPDRRSKRTQFRSGASEIPEEEIWISDLIRHRRRRPWVGGRDNAGKRVNIKNKKRVGIASHRKGKRLRGS